VHGNTNTEEQPAGSRNTPNLIQPREPEKAVLESASSLSLAGGCPQGLLDHRESILAIITTRMY
jgi:hypothetical protein